MSVVGKPSPPRSIRRIFPVSPREAATHWPRAFPCCNLCTFFRFCGGHSGDLSRCSGCLVQRDAGTFSNIVQLSGTLSAHAAYLGILMPNLFAVEKFREATTILILSVAILAEPKRTERFALFLWIFAIWDIGYYAVLWMTVRWPASLT